LPIAELIQAVYPGVESAVVLPSFAWGCQDVFAGDGSDKRLQIKGLKRILPTWQDISSILQSSQPTVMQGKDVVEEPDPANPPKKHLSHCGSRAIPLAS
jgi:hypothetical protein